MHLTMSALSVGGESLHDQREKLDKNYFHAEKILWVALSDHVYYV